MITFVVTENNFNILRTPFFEKYKQNISIQDFTLIFRQSFNYQPTFVTFTTLIEKNFPFSSFFYQINSKKPTYLKPKCFQTLQFPLKKSTAVLIKTGNHEPLFAERHQTHFLSKLK